MIVARYRKRPVEVEAVRFDGYNGVQIIQWADQYQQDLPLIKRMSLDFGMWPDESAQAYRIIIKTLEGAMEARPGDWIIRGVKGEFYPCKNDIFIATYQMVRPPGPECCSCGWHPCMCDQT